LRRERRSRKPSERGDVDRIDGELERVARFVEDRRVVLVAVRDP